MPERRYSDDEVALILREASADQEGGRQRTEEGLSLPQLKQIAAEVGLDPAAVEEAARRVAQRRAAAPSLLFGAPVAPEFEREIPGGLKAEQMAEIVTTIRKVLGRRGITEAELGALEWRARDAMGGRYVSVLPREGETHLRVFGNFRDGLALVTLLGGMASFVLFTSLLAALGLKDVVGAGIVPAGLLLSVLPVRALSRWWFRREEKTLADLTEELDGKIRELAAAGTLPGSEGSE